jgi:hypothetical protein
MLPLALHRSLVGDRAVPKITAATARALSQAGWRRQAFAGPHDPKLVDPEPLSRVAPAVLHGFADAQLAVEQAVDAARTTCQSPLVLDACRALGAMLHAVLRGESRATVLAPAPALFGSRPLKPEVAQIMLHPPAAALPAHAANSGVLGALEAARWAFAHATSFRDGALRAVNCGGNSDVIGAVYGSCRRTLRCGRHSIGPPACWHAVARSSHPPTGCWHWPSCAWRLVAVGARRARRRGPTTVRPHAGSWAAALLRLRL